MGRLKLILAVATIMATLLAMNAGPALADDDGCIGPIGDNGKCIGVETDRDHNDFDHNDFFLNDLDDFEDIDEDFVEIDDCEFFGWDGDDPIFLCEADF